MSIANSCYDRDGEQQSRGKIPAGRIDAILSDVAQHLSACMDIFGEAHQIVDDLLMHGRRTLLIFLHGHVLEHRFGKVADGDIFRYCAAENVSVSSNENLAQEKTDYSQVPC